jgi:hypothetical protein
MTEPANRTPSSTLSAASAFRFVFTLGIVNLFADTVYEGGSSINVDATLSSHSLRGMAVSLVVSVSGGNQQPDNGTDNGPGKCSQWPGKEDSQQRSLRRIGMEDDRANEPNQEANDADHDRHRGAPPSDRSGPPLRPLNERPNHAADNRPANAQSEGGPTRQINSQPHQTDRGKTAHNKANQNTYYG